MVTCDDCGRIKQTKDYCTDKCRVRAFRKKKPGIKEVAKTIQVVPTRSQTDKANRDKMGGIKPCKHGVILGVGSCKFGCA